MKKLLCVIVGVSILISAFSVVSSAKNITEEETVFCEATLDDNFEDDEVIVILKKNYSEINQRHSLGYFDSGVFIDKKDLSSIDENIKVDDLNYLNKENFHQIYLLTLKKPGKENVLKAIEKLEKKDYVYAAFPNYIYTETYSISKNDKYNDNKIEEGIVRENTVYSIEENAVNTTDNYFSLLTDEEKEWQLIYKQKLQLLDAWDITKHNKMVMVGVLDNGIDKENSYLQGEVIINLSKDFTGGNSPFSCYDSHGTECAAIIASNFKDEHYAAGVGTNAKIVSLKIHKQYVQYTLEEGYKYVSEIKASWIAEAIAHAAENNIPILNCSSIVDSDDKNLQNMFDAINNYTGLIICGAGNASCSVENRPYYPAVYNGDNIISVAATDINDEFGLFDIGEFSNYGATKVDLAAPGVDIYCSGSTDDPLLQDGTSMAAPYVTATAALIKGLTNDDFTTAEIKAFIMDNVDPVEALEGKCVTGGRLNVYKAVFAAISSTNGQCVKVSGSNDIYMLAGGAPMYISNWANVGGEQSYTTVTQAWFDNLRQYPADGTLLYDINEDIYTVAGGAPLWVSTYDHIGGYRPSTWIDTYTLNNYTTTGYLSHLRQYPEDGTMVKNEGGVAFRFAGGSPFWIPTWTSIDGRKSFSLADSYTLNRYASSGKLSHIRKRPTDDTYIKVRLGAGVYKYYDIEGGIPYNTTETPENAVLLSADGIDMSFDSAVTWSISGTESTVLDTRIELAYDKDVFKIVAPATGTYDIYASQCGSDIQCRFYSGTTYVKGDDNSGGGTKFKITVSMVEGQTYYLAVDNVVQTTGTRGFYTVVCEPK